ncbi:CP2 transcription factor-domain-containing protein [Aspergillus pseudoustus]|uniref:CP2 transcription factor-domain-containing protein n=1 Tax=Aspergillus pseudoustus TaxID=1810923 RepID=A0ABR4ITH7_9EURO
MGPGAHSNPAMTVMNSHSPQYMLSPNHLPDSHFPDASKSSVAHPVEDLNAHFPNTTITTFPCPPIQNYPVAHDGTIYFGETAQRPLAPRRAYPHHRQADANETGVSYSTSFHSRYRVVLRAPTAMITNASVPPVTYLNKGQRYQLTITDTDPPPHPKDRFCARYRTHIAISFHMEDQRSDSDALWRLWRARRGLCDPGRRQYNDKEGGSGSPDAIGFCLDTPQPVGTGTVRNDGGIGINHQQDVQLETSSFNGFTIVWSGNCSETGASLLPLPECTITVWFNFLTTDFCHYKGVKGFPIQLCASTEMVSNDRGESPLVPAREGAAAEACYCKVNLFRMYGAERKLATDAAAVRKAREKDGTVMRTGLGSDASWKQSTKSYRKNQMRILQQLQEKLVSLREILSSARPVTVLSLRGNAKDIPDLSTDDHSAQYEYASAPYGNHQSTISSGSSSKTGYPWETDLPLGRESFSPGDIQDGTYSNQAIKISRNSLKDETTRYIKVLDIDPTYKPPTLQQSKSVACFYIGFVGAGMTQMQVDYHVAVYLTERTVRNLVEGVTRKLGIDPRRVWCVLLAREKFVQVVDNNVVCEIADGQDMLAEISETWAFDCTSENPIEIRLRY